jgi:hypothetical protein
MLLPVIVDQKDEHRTKLTKARLGKLLVETDGVRTKQFHSLLHYACGVVRALDTAKSRLGVPPNTLVPFASIKCLIECGADLNCKDSSGDTPLHMLSCHALLKPVSCEEVVELGKLMLSKGAHMDVINAHGQQAGQGLARAFPTHFPWARASRFSASPLAPLHRTALLSSVRSLAAWSPLFACIECPLSCDLRTVQFHFIVHSHSPLSKFVWLVLFLYIIPNEPFFLPNLVFRFGFQIFLWCTAKLIKSTSL